MISLKMESFKFTGVELDSLTCIVGVDGRVCIGGELNGVCGADCRDKGDNPLLDDVLEGDSPWLDDQLDVGVSPWPVDPLDG